MRNRQQPCCILDPGARARCNGSRLWVTLATPVLRFASEGLTPPYRLPARFAGAAPHRLRGGPCGLRRPPLRGSPPALRLGGLAPPPLRIGPLEAAPPRSGHPRLPLRGMSSQNLTPQEEQPRRLIALWPDSQTCAGLRGRLRRGLPTRPLPAHPADGRASGTCSPCRQPKPRALSGRGGRLVFWCASFGKTVLQVWDGLRPLLWLNLRGIGDVCGLGWLWVLCRTARERRHGAVNAPWGNAEYRVIVERWPGCRQIRLLRLWLCRRCCLRRHRFWCCRCRRRPLGDLAAQARRFFPRHRRNLPGLAGVGLRRRQLRDLAA